MKIFNLSMAGIAAVACLGAGSAFAETWQMPTRANLENFMTKNIVEFAQEIEEATDGDIKINIQPEDSLFKQPDVKRAVQTGQIPIGDFFMSMHVSENPLFGIDAIPFLIPKSEDGARLRKAVWPYLEKAFSKQGLKLLFAAPWPGNGLYVDRTVKSVADLKGIKFRTQSPLVARMAELMGMVPVTVQMTEVSQAFSTGVIGGMVTSSTTGVDTQAWDFVKNFYDVGALRSWNVVVMNAGKFDSLDADTQKAIMAAADKATERGWQMSLESEKENLAILEEHGMNVEQPSPELVSDMEKIGAAMLEEWKATAGEDGEAALEAFNKNSR